MTHEEIAARASHFVDRREARDWSDEDEAALKAWLAESFAHKAAFWRLSSGWRTAGRLAAVAPLPAIRRPRPLPAIRRPRPWPFRFGLVGIAAGIACLLVVGVMELRLRNPARTEERMAIAYVTPVGGRNAIDLPDGSHMELNTGTRLRSATTKTNRHIWLDEGEAFFKVVHDPAHPFVVDAGRYRVTVLGTSFAVRRQGEAVTVSVVEGRVRVDRANGRPMQIGRADPLLGAGQRAILHGAEMMVTPSDTGRVAQALAWRDGMLSFDGAALSDIAAEFNRYSDRRIVVTDPDVAAIRITGTFRSGSSAAFLRLLREAYGLRVEAQGRDVKISA